MASFGWETSGISYTDIEINNVKGHMALAFLRSIKDRVVINSKEKRIACRQDIRTTKESIWTRYRALVRLIGKVSLWTGYQVSVMSDWKSEILNWVPGLKSSAGKDCARHQGSSMPGFCWAAHLDAEGTQDRGKKGGLCRPLFCPLEFVSALLCSHLAEVSERGCLPSTA